MSYEAAYELLHRAIPSDGVPLVPAHLAIVQELLDQGEDPNGGSAPPDTMNSVLAAALGSVDRLRLLLARGLDLRHPRHREALLQAASRGSARWSGCSSSTAPIRT